jgi:hypothetical protein
MTEKEVKELKQLCDGFSSLSETDKQFTLTVSQALLSMQKGGPPPVKTERPGKQKTTNA